MNRYFLEVAYKGTNYAGSQVQANAITVQAEIEKAMEIFFRKQFVLTGSSRTDAGVHALQNYYHFDSPNPIEENVIYNINAILPADITIKGLIPVKANAHCRFDAIAREYEYRIYQLKNPFLQDRAYYFPFKMAFDKLTEAAAVLIDYTDFTSFSKRNSQVKTFDCSIMQSNWHMEESEWVYRVKGNRFLRGMVRGLVGTMLKVGTGKMEINAFKNVIEAKDNALADFSVPGQGLYLARIEYPKNYFDS
jgi:tRNA pseudouridine38-40 synthase